MIHFAFSLLVITALSSCESKPSRSPVTRALPQTTVNATAMDADVRDVASDTTQPRATTGATDCGGLRGVQMLRLIDGPDGSARQFRFGEEDDARVYTVEWTGDLNGDDNEDRIARRDSDDRPVWMVLVGCGERFAVAWVGLATSVTPTERVTRVDERDWTDLRLMIEGVTRTLEFSGAKYAMSR